MGIHSGCRRRVTGVVALLCLCTSYCSMLVVDGPRTPLYTRPRVLIQRQLPGGGYHNHMLCRRCNPHTPSVVVTRRARPHSAPPCHVHIYCCFGCCNRAIAAILLLLQHCDCCNMATAATLLPLYCYCCNTATAATLLMMQCRCCRCCRCCCWCGCCCCSCCCCGCNTATVVIVWLLDYGDCFDTATITAILLVK